MYLVPAVLLIGIAAGQDSGSKFDICKIRVERIRNGTETFGTINNETIEDYIYDGPVQGMNPEYARTSRNKFLTLKTSGKLPSPGGGNGAFG